MMDILRSGASQLGLQLTPAQLDQFEMYYKELADWNGRINLTSITDYEQVQVRHFLDSLTALQAMGKDIDSLNVLDVGSGAGFPGIPLKIAFPGMELTLLEATGKKVSFLKHLAARLELRDTRVLKGRAEEAAHDPDCRESFDIVLSRALAPLAVLAELTLPFCITGGFSVAMKKGDISQEMKEAEQAIQLLGGKIKPVIDITVDGLEDERKLVVIGKISATPQDYPRRPGVPAKHPLI